MNCTEPATSLSPMVTRAEAGVPITVLGGVAPVMAKVKLRLPSTIAVSKIGTSTVLLGSPAPNVTLPLVAV